MKFRTLKCSHGMLLHTCGVFFFLLTYVEDGSLRTDTARQRLSAAGALLLSLLVQTGTGEHAGAWGVDQRARTLLDAPAELLSAVKGSVLTHTGMQEEIKVKIIHEIQRSQIKLTSSDKSDTIRIYS